MSKEKLNSLAKHSQDIKNKLTSPTPEKHKGHPDTYKLFLERELEAVSKTIENIKATATPTK